MRFPQCEFNPKAELFKDAEKKKWLGRTFYQVKQ
jgi:transcription elongation factor SPT5